MSLGVALAVCVAVLQVATARLPAETRGAEEVVDRRSHEVARLDCSSTLASRDLTLFANGTVRLREREGEKETMRLGELTSDQLEAFRQRLREIDFSETDRGRMETSGEWSVGCRLTLDLEAGESPREFEYGQFDSLSLALGTAVRAVESLEAYIEESLPGSRLPLRYEARVGDVLERWDGLRFEVVGLTVLGGGVELSGVEVPLTIYLPIDDLPRFFVGLVSRREALR